MPHRPAKQAAPDGDGGIWDRPLGKTVLISGIAGYAIGCIITFVPILSCEDQALWEVAVMIGGVKGGVFGAVVGLIAFALSLLGGPQGPRNGDLVLRSPDRPDEPSSPGSTASASGDDEDESPPPPGE